ncbi:MAG TPA: hypothetical protein VJ817_02045 [Gemmatimonadales bacterium]|nr:hypothetical protein [Gemmatimonadales bacterium]
MSARRLAVLLFLSCPPIAPLSAQLQPVTVPRGLLRLTFGGRFEYWDRRYLDGARQDAAGDFIRNPLDGGFLPTLAADEAALRRVTGVQAISLSLGASSGSMLVNVGTGNIGAAYGLGSRLTLFGNVPIVRVRVQSVFGLDSTDATAGFNPAHPIFGNASEGGPTATFLNQLDAALGTVAANLAAGAYDADPARKALAQQTLTQGTTLQTDLEALLLGATFLPLAGSAGAAAITAPIESLRQSLTALAGPGFDAVPAFPTARLSGAAFEGFATNPEGPIASSPFQAPILQYLGDVELGAAFAWLEHRPATGLGVRSVIQGTVRLRTGRLDLPQNFFDRSTGDRQSDLQADLVTDVVKGGFGARITARYVHQLPGRVTSRITPPDQPIASASTTAELERDPGEIVELGIEPFIRIAPTLALVAGVRRWSKGADSYDYTRSQAPIDGLSPDVLAIGSKENATLLSASLSFSHQGIRKDGSIGLPMDASVRWERVIGSSLGRVPERHTIAVQLRLYRRLF